MLSNYAKANGELRLAGPYAKDGFHVVFEVDQGVYVHYSYVFSYGSPSSISSSSPPSKYCSAL